MFFTHHQRISNVKLYIGFEPLNFCPQKSILIYAVVLNFGQCLLWIPPLSFCLPCLCPPLPPSTDSVVGIAGDGGDRNMEAFPSADVFIRLLCETPCVSKLCSHPLTPRPLLFHVMTTWKFCGLLCGLNPPVSPACRHRCPACRDLCCMNSLTEDFLPAEKAASSANIPKLCLCTHVFYMQVVWNLPPFHVICPPTPTLTSA